MEEARHRPGEEEGGPGACGEPHQDESGAASDDQGAELARPRSQGGPYTHLTDPAGHEEGEDAGEPHRGQEGGRGGEGGQEEGGEAGPEPIQAAWRPSRRPSARMISSCRSTSSPSDVLKRKRCCSNHRSHAGVSR